MNMSPEKGPSTPEKKGEPFIWLHFDTTTEEDRKKMEEIGWTQGTIRMGGEIPFYWEKDGEPILPDHIDAKTYKVEYSVPVTLEKNERKVPAIKFADELPKKTVDRLEKMGWVKQPAGSDGSVALLWFNETKPELPNDLKDDVEIGQCIVGPAGKKEETDEEEKE